MQIYNALCKSGDVVICTNQLELLQLAEIESIA